MKPETTQKPEPQTEPIPETAPETAAPEPEAPKPVRVIVLAGQSNAVGVGHAMFLPDHFSDEQINKWRGGFRKVQINFFSHNFKSGRFVPTKIGYAEQGRDTFGPEIGIADELTRRFPDETFYIVKCAFGGMSLHQDWLSPSGGAAYDAGSTYENREAGGGKVRAGWCWNELTALLSESLAALENKGLAPKICAFFWMQGESDALDPVHAAQYIGLYDALLTDFRAAFGDYLDGCVYADAGISEIWTHYQEVNQAKKDYADAHENCVFLDTIAAGLTTANEPVGAPDIAHYDSESMIRLGRMFGSVLP